MTIRVGVYLAAFWAMQVVAQVLFKWGSTGGSRWVWGFVVGNVLGFFSVWLLMLVYKAIHPNIALGIAIGGAFLLCQVALAIVFKSTVRPVQWAGIVAIVIGMALLAGGGAREPEHVPAAPQESSHNR